MLCTVSQLFLVKIVIFNSQLTHFQWLWALFFSLLFSISSYIQSASNEEMYYWIAFKLHNILHNFCCTFPIFSDNLNLQLTIYSFVGGCGLWIFDQYFYFILIFFEILIFFFLLFSVVILFEMLFIFFFFFTICLFTISITVGRLNRGTTVF